jgi:hypothetical protein
MRKYDHHISQKHSNDLPEVNYHDFEAISEAETLEQPQECNSEVLPALPEFRSISPAACSHPDSASKTIHKNYTEEKQTSDSEDLIGVQTPSKPADIFILTRYLKNPKRQRCHKRFSAF